MTRSATLTFMMALLASACVPMAPRDNPSPGPDVTDKQPAQTDPEVAGPASQRTDGAEPAPADSAGDDEASTEPAEQVRPEASSGSEPDTHIEAAESQPKITVEPAPEPSAEPTSEPDSETTPDTRPTVTNSIDIEGRVILSGGDADPTETVIYFVPDQGNADSDPGVSDSLDARQIVTQDKSLSPTVMAVPRGTEIQFPNEDPILHNLFSVSPGNDFDLGIYGPGDSPSVSFDESGVVNIYCNVHHDMHAHVLVVDTPWRTRADASGRFSLGDLPAGKGVLHVWHRQAERWSRAVTLPKAAPFEIALEVTRPRLPAHRDKIGQPYNRRNRDPYR